MKPHAVLIEDKASGISLLQELRQMTQQAVIAIQPEGDKVMRAVRITPIIESGRISLPINASWLAEFESEITAFPYGANDDQVDSVTQFLNWNRGSGTSSLTVPTTSTFW